MSGQTRTFIIAEVGQAHDGSLGILHSYIDAVAATGVDAVKFQTHVADAESSAFEPFRVEFSYEDPTRRDYWRRMEFTADQWTGIKRHCDEAGLEFMSTPSCVEAVDVLERVGVRRYKIGSGDTTNHLLLQRVALTGRPVILSTGMSTDEEIDAAVALLNASGIDVTIMQCTSDYPTPNDRLGLNLIGDLRHRHGRPVGLSDHSGSVFPPIAAVALGASYLESHVVFDKRMFGPDSRASLTVDELKMMVEGVRTIEASLQSGYRRNPSADMRQIFGKTLSVRRAMAAGEAIRLSDLESTKPAGRGVAAADYATVLGRVLRRDLAKGEFVQESDLAPL